MSFQKQEAKFINIFIANLFQQYEQQSMYAQTVKEV
jgi:hypothetical protein